MEQLLIMMINMQKQADMIDKYAGELAVQSVKFEEPTFRAMICALIENYCDANTQYNAVKMAYDIYMSIAELSEVR